MGWTLLIAIAIALILLYGYWDHTSHSRNLTKMFASLAHEYDGTVDAGGVLTLPKLRFDKDGRTYLATALATSGGTVAGGSGYSGPFTFVSIDMPDDLKCKVQIVKSGALGEKFVDQIVSGMKTGTGDEEFDEAFRVLASDKATATKVLDAPLRLRLLKSELPRLDARINGRTITVHMDGYALSQREVEELIQIADQIAGKLV